MKKVTVAPGELFTVKHKVPRRRVVEFKVIANDPVDTYVLNESELKRLRMGRKYETYGGFDGRTFHHQVVELFDLRAPDSWYLSVYNPGDNDTDVYYEVLA